MHRHNSFLLRKRICKALLGAFPNHANLEQMVYLGLGERLVVIAGSGSLNATVVALLMWAEAHNKVKELLDAAIDANPDNKALKKVYKHFHA